MATLYQVRDNKGCGTEPMTQAEAESIRRQWLDRTGTTQWGSHRTGYQAFVREVEVTDREFALYVV